jgi:hypothetical protein
MKECILAAVTASMAIATFLLAYQTLKMRREQIRPVLAIHQYWEDENPPRTGSDYEMVAYDGGGKLLDLALGKSDEKTIVYYIMINNLGNGSAKNLEMRMKRVLEKSESHKLCILEENSVCIGELYPGGAILVPVLALDVNVSETIVQCIVRYLGSGLGEKPWASTELTWPKRLLLGLTLRVREIPRLEAKRNAFYKALWDSEVFAELGPVKNLTLPQFAVTKHEVVSSITSNSKTVSEGQNTELRTCRSRIRAFFGKRLQ